MMNLSSLSKAKAAAIGAMVTAVLSTLAGFAGGSVMVVVSVVLLFGTLACLAASILYLRKTESEIKRMNVVCVALAQGNFEARLTNITEKGELGEFQWAVNEMADYMDAFVREATAAMEYVSRNQYFRYILEGGMHGSLLRGARVINQAMKSVEEKMNGFVDVANDFDVSLKEVVSEINGTVGTLEGVAKNMELTVTSTKEGADTAVKTSDDTSANVQTISAAAEQMSSSIAEISQQVTRTSQIASNAVTESDKAKQTIEELVEMTNKISDVSQLIEDIAEQTNLLALNATIEAARAGEAGKGFAVVASEVKGLSSQTAKATEDIGEHIRGIQEATQHAVKAFDSIGGVIGEINESATVVAAAIEEQSAASQEIASNAERASVGTMGMAGNVREISQSIGQVDEAAAEVVSVTTQLSRHATEKVEALLGKMGVFIIELKKIA